jgi:general secretion pathway protein G
MDMVPPGRRSVARGAGTQTGFSLIEIMVVIVIIGIMAALIVPRLMDRPDQARATAARQDIASLMQALKLYRLDHGRYPDARQGLKALVEAPAGDAAAPAGSWQAYLERLPPDPWGHPYQYANPGRNGEVDVFSFGADGAAGGDKQDADIGSWQL